MGKLPKVNASEILARMNGDSVAIQPVSQPASSSSMLPESKSTLPPFHTADFCRARISYFQSLLPNASSHWSESYQSHIDFYTSELAKHNQTT